MKDTSDLCTKTNNGYHRPLYCDKIRKYKKSKRKNDAKKNAKLQEINKKYVLLFANDLFDILTITPRETTTTATSTNITMERSSEYSIL